MSAQLFTVMLTVFVLGLFVGSNLGVILMCLLQMAGRDRVTDAELASFALQAED